MGILSGIFKSRDKPQNSTSGSAYRFFLGGSTSGKMVTERSAMQMTAVYTIILQKGNYQNHHLSAICFRGVIIFLRMAGFITR